MPRASAAASPSGWRSTGAAASPALAAPARSRRPTRSTAAPPLSARTASRSPFVVPPPFNVAMKRDARHFSFIKVTRTPAPKLLVVRGASDDAIAYYGPFHGAYRVGEAVRELSDVLGLRDCALDYKMHFADQPELFEL